jgi:signal transduction histidine kinase
VAVTTDRALRGLAVDGWAAAAVALGTALAAWMLAERMRDRAASAAEPLSIDDTFAGIRRASADVQVHPGRRLEATRQLLVEVFDPRRIDVVDGADAADASSNGARRRPAAQVLSGGSVMIVGVPRIEDASEARAWLRLQHARQGRRRFTAADARLADLLVEQVQRAAAYDDAVERGRAEERLRLAQDLHDDIGARLLTLMYQAPNPQVEDYVRHTLQDLKTLTRGLAAGSQPLADAAAEWKADLQQRLDLAGIALDWSLEADREIVLGTRHWSSLTRIVRELVSNAIAHAGAGRLEVRLRVEGGALSLVVADDGGGRAPQAWSHGLGLAGVRKRVKALAGDVRWLEGETGGIVCEVTVPLSTPGVVDEGAGSRPA